MKKGAMAIMVAIGSCFMVNITHTGPLFGRIFKWSLAYGGYKAIKGYGQAHDLLWVKKMEKAEGVIEGLRDSAQMYIARFAQKAQAFGASDQVDAWVENCKMLLKEEIAQKETE